MYINKGINVKEKVCVRRRQMIYVRTNYVGQ